MLLYVVTLVQYFCGVLKIGEYLMSTEDLFWKDMDNSFIDIIKAVTSLSTKSYISISNLKTDITWWSERAMDYFNLKENYTVRGTEKGNRSVHPDDVEVFRNGFKERLAGINMDKSWEYRINDGGVYHRFSAMARLIYDNEHKPLYIIVRYDNYGISDNIDSVTGLYSDSILNNKITNYVTTNDRQTALLKIGINQFSHINVMYGITFSDKILNNVAQTLLSIIKNIGTVYRSSGANFIICFEDISKDELHQVYEDIAYALSNNIVIENMKVPLKICAGAVWQEGYDC